MGHTDIFQPPNSRAPVNSRMEIHEIVHIPWGNIDKLENKCIVSTTRHVGQNYNETRPQRRRSLGDIRTAAVDYPGYLCLGDEVRRRCKRVERDVSSQ